MEREGALYTDYTTAATPRQAKSNISVKNILGIVSGQAAPSLRRSAEAQIALRRRPLTGTRRTARPRGIDCAHAASAIRIPAPARLPFSRPALRFRLTSPSAAFTLPVCHCPQWGIVVLWSRSNRILTRASLPGRAAGSIMVQSRRNAGICLHRTGWPSRWGRLP